ncbi:hypothetical protein GCM10020367_18650 [Streptomyces sannanensis]|uniref:Uncharacterized protein n=1 Tax=Streptomyces sannanensis TaxID=285536 RepID=A0ABP6S8G9_9ACTN
MTRTDIRLRWMAEPGALFGRAITGIVTPRHVLTLPGRPVAGR